ncbi:hypothetical protein DL95DRAFT_133510 [Leptodontidium sp. 2 PMI_412]|nr:hypothetical protein DL95DRAFT_133510 [Leptodontidium sp. 2 PMI_412]
MFSSGPLRRDRVYQNNTLSHCSCSDPAVHKRVSIQGLIQVLVPLFHVVICLSLPPSPLSPPPPPTVLIPRQYFLHDISKLVCDP